VKERSRNKLKDFLTIAPALGVTHLLAFTLAPIAPALHMIRLPAGPSLSFRIERYSLAKDVRAGSKHARSIGLEYLSPPLVRQHSYHAITRLRRNVFQLVLASFPQPGPDTPPQLPLMMKAFQSLFPPLAPGSLALSSARRVVLVSYNVEQGTVEIRHYAIAVRPAGVSKRVRRVVEGPSARLKSASGVVDLSRERDVADYVLRQAGADGYESAASDASSAAGEDDAAAVALAQDYVGRGNKKGSRRAVRLDEIGPRLELRLVKITEGVPGREGQVIFHEFGKNHICFCQVLAI
jgi:ribosome biogenesis protein SSF1/2